MKAIRVNTALLQDVEREVACAALEGKAAGASTFNAAFLVVGRERPGDKDDPAYRTFTVKQSLVLAKKYVEWNRRQAGKGAR